MAPKQKLKKVVRKRRERKVVERGAVTMRTCSLSVLVALIKFIIALYGIINLSTLPL